MKNVTGLVNFHCEPDLEPLTSARPLGSTSFLGRYAFCDFALSNLCNSGISQVGLLVKDQQRSILKHLGSMNSWVINTKIGHQRILYNEPGHLNPRLNTDVNNLLENDWLLYDANSQYIVIVPSYLIGCIDLRPFIKAHIKDEERQVTIVASQQRNLKTHWRNAKILEFDAKGKLLDFKLNDGSDNAQRAVALDIIIINRPSLINVIRRHGPLHPEASLFSLIFEAYKEGGVSLNVDYYDGFVRMVDSFEHYMEYCLELLDQRKAVQLFNPDWPIYTLTHDTPPALYGEFSDVHNSYVSNGARIEGKVINSIIARNVQIGKGAVVKNSIIFSTVRINEGAAIENALIDKYSIIERGHVIKGKAKEPIYVHQGAIL